MPVSHGKCGEKERRPTGRLLKTIHSPLRLGRSRPLAAFGGRPLRRNHLLHAVGGFRGRGLDRRQGQALDQQLDLGGVQHFAFDQRLRDPDQRFPILREDALRRRVPRTHHLPDFFVNLDGGGFAVVAVLRDLASEENLLFFLAEGQPPQVAHAPFANHLARQFRGPLNVVASARRHLAQEKLFRDTPAHQDGNLRVEIVLVVVVAIVGRQLHGQTERHAARYDRDLVHRIGVRQHGSHQRVPSLVVRGVLLLFIGEQKRLAFHTHQHFIFRHFEVVHQYGFAVLTGSRQRRFIHHVGQVGAGESRRAAGQNLQIHIVRQGNLAGVYTQNFFPSANIRTIHHHAPVETPRAQERRIEHVRTVGRRHQDHAFVRFEAVHFHQQLIQSLLALIVSTAEPSAAVTSDGVNFVDEDDARSVLLALFEQIAHAARAHAHEHFHKVRAGDGEERNVRFARYGARQQGLARSRRSNQQHALRNTPAKFLELLRLAQKLDNFAKFFLRLIHASHVFERDLFLLHGEQPRPALAERKRLVPTCLHLPDHEEPESAKQNQRQQIKNPAGPGAVADVLEAVRNILLRQLLVHVGIVRRHNRMKRRVVLKLAFDFLADKHHVADIALIHVGQEFRKADFFFLLRVAPGFHNLPEQEGRDHYDRPEKYPLNRRIHLKLL